MTGKRKSAKKPKSRELKNVEPQGCEHEDEFWDFLRSGRTIGEMVEKFKRYGLTETKVRKMLDLVPADKKIFKDDTLPGVDRYYCIPVVRHGNILPRIWSCVKEADGGPAVDIIFPDDIGWRKNGTNGREDKKLEKMRIVPLADIWFGHNLYDSAGFEERLNWIAQEPHVFCFFNGDCIHPHPARKTNDKDWWDQLCSRFYKKLDSITHKILWAQAGCFEHKMFQLYYDPMQHFCESWDIPYFQTPVSVGIHWAGKLFKFYCIHGKTQAQKKGSKINAAMRALAQTEFTHFYVMSHIRDSIASKPTRVIEDVIGLDLKEKTQYAFITPSFVKYDGSRDSRWGYPLPARGQINCALYKSGDAFLYSSSPTSNLMPYNSAKGEV